MVVVVVACGESAAVAGTGLVVAVVCGVSVAVAGTGDGGGSDGGL